MKLKIKVLLILLLTGTFYSFAQNNMGIGTNTPDPSALVDMQATDKGMLVPRMTTAQRTAIVSPANALLVYDTDAQCFYYFKTATGWTDLCTGIVGPAGPAGPQGAMGLTGPAGANGLDGAVGAAGPAGPQGPQGPAGADGVAGPVGPQGPQGASVLGGTGPQGPAGPAGANGIDGAVGPQGPIGLTGPAGATGPAGPQGPQGTAGADGAPGVAGPAGPQGPIGLTGPAGANGANGIDGAVGPAGATGPQGPAGPNNVKKYTVLGTTNATVPANAGAGPFVDMPEMTITFTPINNAVIMLFTAAGTYTNTAYENHSVWFEVLVNGVSIREWDTQCGTGWNLWDIGVSTPLNVNVGVPNTIKIRWTAQRAGTVNTTINNLAFNGGTYFNRSMQIIDAP